MKRALIVTHSIPAFPGGGAPTRDYCLAREMASRHEVTFLLPDYGEASRADAGPLKSFCHVRFFESASRQPWSLTKRLLYSVNQRLPIERTWRLVRREPAMVQELEPSFPVLQEILKRIDWEEFDLLQVEHSHLGAAFVAVDVPVPKILDWHNVHSLIAGRRLRQASGRLERLRAWHEFRRIQRSEARVVSRFEHSVAVSDSDADAIRNLNGRVDVTVVPNGVDSVYFSNPEPGNFERRSLVFTGTMDYKPNEEGVLFFCDKVLPRIMKEEPEVRLFVVGQRPSPVVSDLEKRFPGTVQVTGFVADVRPYLQRAAVIVVPLLNGGGTRLKILEALAMRKPVVSTAIGAEGLQLENGREIEIADKPETFAKAILSLLLDQEGRERLSEQGYRAVKSQFDWGQTAKRLNHAWEQAGSSRG